MHRKPCTLPQPHLSTRCPSSTCPAVCLAASVFCSFPLSSHLKVPHFLPTSSFIFLHSPCFLSISRPTAPDWELFILTALFFWRVVRSFIHQLTSCFLISSLPLFFLFLSLSLSLMSLCRLCSPRLYPPSTPPEFYHSSLPGGLALDG